MSELLNAYLRVLEEALQTADPATRQDALADAEEYLSSARDNRPVDDPSEELYLQAVIETYGAPAEIASAYLDMERLSSPELTRHPTRTRRSWLGRFLGIYLDTRAWGALIYLISSLASGILYFTWVVTGISVSLSLSIFIFGLPLLVLFLLSLRGLALLEGRLVEALLGVRMPRRPLFSPQGGRWIERLKGQLSDHGVWRGLLYMVFQLLLGIGYFSLFVSLIALGVALIGGALTQLISGRAVFFFPSGSVLLPLWGIPLTVLGGFLVLTVTMHLARILGRLHAGYAKRMLVVS